MIPCRKESFALTVTCKGCGCPVTIRANAEESATDAVLLWHECGERCEECREKEKDETSRRRLSEGPWTQAEVILHSPRSAHYPGRSI